MYVISMGLTSVEALKMVSMIKTPIHVKKLNFIIALVKEGCSFFNSFCQIVSNFLVTVSVLWASGRRKRSSSWRGVLTPFINFDSPFAKMAVESPSALVLFVDFFYSSKVRVYFLTFICFLKLEKNRMLFNFENSKYYSNAAIILSENSVVLVHC